MGTVVRLFDRLVNLMSGTGTTADKSTYRQYYLQRLDSRQIEAAYRTSWLMRKAVDLPPYDMTRAGRDWQADKPTIEKLEAEEKRLGIWDALRRALVLARLGGAGMVLYVDGDDQEQPLDPARIRTGMLKTVHVWHRDRFALGQMIDAWSDPWFGHPRYYQVQLGGASGLVKFHPSRVIAFKGQQVPDMATNAWEDCFWGDSIAQSIQDAVANADAAQAGFAALIEEAKLDIIKMPDLMANAATAEYEQRFMERFRLAALGKSTHRALVLDGDEDWEQRQINWAGMPDIIATYIQIVAGAADIPATRLLGKSPDGMNATGKGDETNYLTMITGRQENDLRPQIERLDTVLIPSALGKPDPAVWWKFAPLQVPTEAEEATTFKTVMDALDKLVSMRLVPEIAMEKGAQNLLEERGWIPGLGDALAELPDDERFPSLSEPDLDDDPSALQAGGQQQPKGGGPQSGRPGGANEPASARRVSDAER